MIMISNYKVANVVQNIYQDHRNRFLIYNIQKQMNITPPLNRSKAWWHMLHAVLLYVLRFVQKAANQCPSEMGFRSLSKRSHYCGQIQGICRVVCCKKIALHRIPLVPRFFASFFCFVWHCLVPDYDHCFTLTWTWSCWSSKYLPLLGIRVPNQNLWDAPSKTRSGEKSRFRTQPSLSLHCKWPEGNSWALEFLLDTVKNAHGLAWWIREPWCLWSFWLRKPDPKYTIYTICNIDVNKVRLYRYNVHITLRIYTSTYIQDLPEKSRIRFQTTFSLLKSEFVYQTKLGCPYDLPIQRENLPLRKPITLIFRRTSKFWWSKTKNKHPKNNQARPGSFPRSNQAWTHTVRGLPSSNELTHQPSRPGRNRLFLWAKKRARAKKNSRVVGNRYSNPYSGYKPLLLTWWSSL